MSVPRTARWLIRAARSIFKDPRIREFLWFCAPAMLLGLMLRVLMTWQMPYGYMQFDSEDFLSTAHGLLSKGRFLIHSKRTFLVPILYVIPFFLRVPALIVIPIAQHLLGLGVVLMSGALTRLWLRPWKWVIVPVTLLLAADPVLLWFEHALMSESVYLFCVFSLALAGTLFARRRTMLTFVLLLVALFFTGGARPEGRLFLCFVLLLVVLVDWGNWKSLRRRLACLAGFALIMLPITQTGQAGQLLYATVLPLAPDESKVDPEFGRKVRPLRDQIQASSGGVWTELTSLEKKLTEMAQDHMVAAGERDPDTNLLCRNLAIEACLNQPWALPGLAYRKFLHANNGPVSIGYDEPILQKKLNTGFNRKGMLDVLARGLVGHDLKDEAAVEAFVQEHYRPFSWYPFLDDAWWHFTQGGRHDKDPVGFRGEPPLSPFFILALAGMVIAVVMRDQDQRFHFAWIVTLGGLWFAVELTGVVNPRYRYVFEPFCLLYIAFGIGVCAHGIWRRLLPTEAP